MKKAIVFGPWVGEFSYELSWWVPEIRKLRKQQFSDHTAIHIGFKGRQAMYKDFIDEYIPYSEDLKSLITYPSMHGVFVNGQHIIPRKIFEFAKQAVADRAKDFATIIHYPPGPTIIQKRMQQFPDGEYKSLEADPKMLKKVKHQLSKFKHQRKVASVMANIRLRHGQLEPKVWNPVHWQEFIIKLIEKSKLNVVLTGVPRKGDYPGALSLKDSPLLQGYKDFIQDHVFEDDNTLDHQIALLKSVKCSIWGSTGAIVLAYFTNTPAFGFFTTELGYRFRLGWQQRLTNGHKHVHIFDKYPSGSIFDIPVKEIYSQFLKFYRQLD